ncbi:MAG: hypothetical protein LBS56_10255, partial [Propionibacteriaceae bacterium]|nr:hypothetical protein [Propionibacteriaceae bacterium]
MPAQRLGQRWQVGFDHVADDVDVDPEVLVLWKGAGYGRFLGFGGVRPLAGWLFAFHNVAVGVNRCS